MASKRLKKKRRKTESCCVLCGAAINYRSSNYAVGVTGKAVCAKCLWAGRQSLPTAKPSFTQNSAQLILPSSLALQLDQKIIGQEQAKRAVAVAMWKQMLRKKGFDLPNCGLLLYGPTGCGKTALVREAASIAGLPFLCFDATSLTEAGYRGKDASDVLVELTKRYSFEKARYAVVFLDEVDKLAAVKGNEYRSSYSRGTQHSLLKLLDGGDFSVDGTTFSTKDLLFLFGGAFTGLRAEKHTERNQLPIGFQRGEQPQEAEDALTMEDLIHWGMEPELMGRIGRIVPLQSLTRDQLRQVLLCSDLSFYRRYQLAFARQGFSAELTEDEIESLIDRSLALGLGARGLNALVEQAMEEKLLQISEDWHE